MKLAILNNSIAEADFKQNQEVPIEMLDSEKTQYSNEWRTYRERNSQLIKHRGQAFSLILGQCTQLLQDKMKQDVDWTTVSTSYDPLTLYRLIEKTILGQTEDQYPFATVTIRSGTRLLLVSARHFVESSMVRTVQYKGRCWHCNRCHATA